MALIARSVILGPRGETIYPEMVVPDYWLNEFPEFLNSVVDSGAVSEGEVQSGALQDDIQTAPRQRRRREQVEPPQVVADSEVVDAAADSEREAE